MKKNKQLTKKLVTSTITQKRLRSQHYGRKYANEYTSQNAETTSIPAIFDCVRDRELTTALNFLEKHGVTGDTALFVVASIQKLGGAK